MTFEGVDAFDELRNAWKEQRDRRESNGRAHVTNGFAVWDIGEEPLTASPREWLLGNQFCRGFISSIVAGGGTGKTALRMLQFVSLASGRPLCGQHIFKRARVLLVSLEDDDEEMKRRIKAILDFYDLPQSELAGWLWCACPKTSKLAYLQNRNRVIGTLGNQIREEIKRRQIDLVSLDPFIKTHGLAENDNSDMDFVCNMLASIASECNVAVDSPHHVHKGLTTPGDADAGRGASGIKDAGRLVYTLCIMSEDEARQFGIDVSTRWSYIRLDPAKTNIAVHSSQATWFRLLGQNIGNGTPEYPNGDNVQVAEPWKPREKWEGTDSLGLNKVLDAIASGMEGGRRYSNAPAAADRAVWPTVQAQYPEKTEAQCRQIIHAWLESGLLRADEYRDVSDRKVRKGLFVDDAKRPS